MSEPVLEPRSHPCWKCHERVGSAVCVGCGAPQPPPASPDPFTVLGLERRYHLDLQAVEDAYKRLTRRLHPDRFAGKAALERRMSLQWTAILNDARRVLRDPIRRARLLATGSPDPKERGGPRLDPEFLQQMFTWREEEEENPGSMLVIAKEQAALVRDELDRLFSAWESGQGDLSLVDDRLARLKYLDGLAGEPH